jgi:hypothetical protein
MRAAFVLLLLAVGCGDNRSATTPFDAPLWTVALGGHAGADGNAESAAMSIDGAGDVVAAGSFDGAIDLGCSTDAFSHANPWGTSSWLTKRSGADGSCIWGQTFALVPGQSLVYSALATDADGDIVTTGSFGGTVDFGGTALTADLQDRADFVAKYDPAGQLLWVKPLPPHGGFIGAALAVSADGRIYVSDNCFYADTILGQPVTCQAVTGLDYIAALEPDGSLGWINLYGSALGMHVAVTATSDLVATDTIDRPTMIAGQPLAPVDRENQIAIGISKDGTTTWVQQFADSPPDSIASSIAIAPHDRIVTATNHRNQLGTALGPSVRTLNGNGDAVWHDVATGSARTTSMAVSPSGMIVIGGSLANGTLDFGTGPLVGDVFLAAYTSNGHPIEVRAYAPVPAAGTDPAAPVWGFFDAINGLAIGRDGTVGVAATIDQSIDFGLGTVAVPPPSTVDDDEYTSTRAVITMFAARASAR